MNMPIENADLCYAKPVLLHGLPWLIHKGSDE